MSLEPGLSQQKISVVQEQTNDKKMQAKLWIYSHLSTFGIFSLDSVNNL